jgi:hypothetical protein
MTGAGKAFDGHRARFCSARWRTRSWHWGAAIRRKPVAPRSLDSTAGRRRAPRDPSPTNGPTSRDDFPPRGRSSIASFTRRRLRDRSIAAVIAIHRPEIEGAAYLEFTLRDARGAAGYVLASTGGDDFPIIAWSDRGTGGAQALASRSHASGVVRIFTVGLGTFVAELGDGTMVSDGWQLTRQEWNLRKERARRTHVRTVETRAHATRAWQRVASRAGVALPPDVAPPPSPPGVRGACDSELGDHLECEAGDVEDRISDLSGQLFNRIGAPVNTNGIYNASWDTYSRVIDNSLLQARVPVEVNAMTDPWGNSAHAWIVWGYRSDAFGKAYRVNMGWASHEAGEWVSKGSVLDALTASLTHGIDGSGVVIFTPQALARDHGPIVTGSGQCFDAASARTDEGAAVGHYPCHEGDNQLWYLDRTSSDAAGWQVRSRSSAQCLAPVGGGASNARTWFKRLAIRTTRTRYGESKSTAKSSPCDTSRPADASMSIRLSMGARYTCGSAAAGRTSFSISAAERVGRPEDDSS